ncbi:neurotrimin, putative, partial [Ixodes scapularis]
RRVVKGANLSLPCAASGHPEPKLTWYRITRPTGIFFLFRKNSDGSIFFVRVQKESQGMYRCSAANGIGAPLNKTVKVTVTATCSVITGSPPFTFRWLKNNKDLQEDGAVTIENWKDYSNLAITKLAKSHAANYTCIATNAAGSDRYTNGLVVN